MGGTITPTDTPGGGLTMTVALPTVASVQGGDRIVTRVLVIDDDHQLLRALRITLTARGYHVTTVADGTTALAAGSRPTLSSST